MIEPDVEIDHATAAEHCHDLWIAAILVLVGDAHNHIDKCADPDGEFEAAYTDLVSCGIMTRHLAALASANPRVISAKFVESLGHQRGQRRRKIGMA